MPVSSEDAHFPKMRAALPKARGSPPTGSPKSKSESVSSLEPLAASPLPPGLPLSGGNSGGLGPDTSGCSPHPGRNLVGQTRRKENSRPATRHGRRGVLSRGGGGHGANFTRGAGGDSPGRLDVRQGPGPPPHPNPNPAGLARAPLAVPALRTWSCYGRSSGSRWLPGVGRLGWHPVYLPKDEGAGGGCLPGTRISPPPLTRPSGVQEDWVGGTREAQF